MRKKKHLYHVSYTAANSIVGSINIYTDKKIKDRGTLQAINSYISKKQVNGQDVVILNWIYICKTRDIPWDD